MTLERSLDRQAPKKELKEGNTEESTLDRRIAHRHENHEQTDKTKDRPERPQSGGPIETERKADTRFKQRNNQSVLDNEEQGNEKKDSGEQKKMQKVFIREKLRNLKEMEEKLKRERLAS